MLSLLTALMGCKLIDKIKNRGRTEDAGTTTTVTVNPAPTTPLLADSGVAVAIPLPNPTVAPNPTEIPAVDAAVPQLAVPDAGAIAMPDVPAVPAPVAAEDAGAPAAPPGVPPPAGGTIPDQIAGCNTQNATNAQALAACLQALIPTATARNDLAALAEAMYSCENTEARALLRRDAYRLMDQYCRRYHGDRNYNRFKDRIDRRR